MGASPEDHRVYNYPHPNNPLHNPAHPARRQAAYNPLTRNQKWAIGIAAGVTALGAATAIILLPRQAKASPLPPVDDKKKSTTPSGKPPGSPPPYGDSCFPQSMGGTQAYDHNFWDAGGVVPARERIFNHFEALGYQTPTDRSTMNDPGPDAALGGGDDVPNAEVANFQKDYNRGSRRKLFPNMGGLWEDGFVGPCTLNGVKYVMEQLSKAGSSPDQWKALARGETTLS